MTDSWSLADEAELRRLLGDGHSMLQCARRMGRSKNGVHSKMQRLGLRSVNEKRVKGQGAVVARAGRVTLPVLASLKDA